MSNLFSHIRLQRLMLFKCSMLQLRRLHSLLKTLRCHADAERRGFDGCKHALGCCGDGHAARQTPRDSTTAAAEPAAAAARAAGRPSVLEPGSSQLLQPACSATAAAAGPAAASGPAAAASGGLPGYVHARHAAECHGAASYWSKPGPATAPAATAASTTRLLSHCLLRTVAKAAVSLLVAQDPWVQ